MSSSGNLLVLACIVTFASFVCCDSTTVSPAPPSPGAPAPQSPGAPAGGPLPPITPGAASKDVLGDYEKGQVCKVQAAPFCQAAGPADSLCTSLAQAAGLTTDASCSSVGVCKFTVTKPQQHPDKPGVAYLTSGAQTGYGVIFPCQNGQVVIAVPNNELSGAPAPTAGPTDATTTQAPK